MSNPLSSLRKIISPGAAMRGVVVEVTGAAAKVATPKGLAEYPLISGLHPGDQVTITKEGRLIKATEAAVYWV